MNQRSHFYRSWTPRAIISRSLAKIGSCRRLETKPNVCIDVTRSSYQIKTADTLQEHQQVQKMRSQIFNAEYARENINILPDTDIYDRYADVLVIKDLKSQRIVGTYRMICSKFSQEYYSASEFDITDFVSQKGKVYVELSRACIEPKYRNGSVLAMLWQGIYAYLSKVGATYLFGCSSIIPQADLSILSLISYLSRTKSGYDEYDISPLKDFDYSVRVLKELKNISLDELAEDGFDLKKLPPLMRGYLRAGACFAPVPAYDASFNCYDFFTVLEVAKMAELHQRKLGRNL